ncbi:MAG: GNAT family N-acetyltransferase [Bacteroidales bacterium]|nr:GNAT family N-acetyltransferase [Bacteroidales bacterium]
MIIERSVKSDLENIKTLLLDNDLPIDDLDDEGIQLFVVKIDYIIVGVIGLENYNTIGLLRSLAVKEQYKNQRIGEKLINYLVQISNRLGIQELYLLTTTADKYFEKFDFRRMIREYVPESIKNTK